MAVLLVNNVTTDQRVALIVVQTGLHQIQENLLLAVMLVPAATHLVLAVQLVMTELLVVNGLLRDQLVMIVLLEENGLIQDQLVMTELLAESGLLKDHSVMTDHLVVNGLLRDQLVMIVLLVVSGVILVQHVMSEVQEILVDQIVWKEMTTDSVHSMVLETRLQTRRLSLKM